MRATKLTVSSLVGVGSNITLAGSTGSISSSQIVAGLGASNTGDVNAGPNGITLFGTGGANSGLKYKLQVDGSGVVSALLISWYLRTIRMLLKQSRLQG